jgi:hypothetical protein
MHNNNTVVPLVKVDMTAGSQGYIEFRNGQKLWTVTIQRDGELFKVRLDMGVYHEVDVTGRVDPTKEHAHDIVAFDPKMKWLESQRRFIPTEIRLC